ncbi:MULTISPECIES: PrsW family intramembrane metalloprotease [unclassified Rathayibacter]|jgi:RsiW-degrading membrane proteinase PrsW (M82 family)|uniref:PrsW family intramembrane metalloprotease n=1 Tax=unclassified Rathayibacter TaxID=2609250 RepID=UPI000CE85756|nr:MULTISPECIES: PrsW family intramembrane metalloprotease [unclassified Rathayibacter]PPF12083.1 PrsW family intramembrane metalloprotease [Rathayibacter sp. AY1A5]PPF16579.1 PrsW family intramembrane metalloprotease [Rathayibacter sp. AY1A4]PPF21085.1 PrsW family intramembrane metalloprotease [Rathayibacter sp. AY1A7]PPF28689.1 PrsW family intramembrane metalloprotease [Rathayibacter sp. AY1F2]PPF38830.1 PrsW family intramembrane metalloprotease [Rathayibacter sp. AY1A3]
MSAYPPPAPPATARPSVVPTVLGSIGVALLGILLLLVLAYVVLGLGVSAAGICAVIALVPLTVVLLGVRWVDRWEPEPALGLWFAFLWGAAGSVAIALLVDLGVQIAVYASGQQPSGSDFVGAVIQAPLVEETAKGIGVLLVLLIWRRTFDGPVDGIVYAAVVASGFAFVENILYFGSALVEGGLGSLAVTFFLRGVLSPFAHVLFTACTGAALGFASNRPAVARLPIALLGLALAAFLHALWNGSSFLVSDWFGFYGVVQVPLFAVAVVVVVLLRRQERRVTLQRLDDYAVAGWLSPAEVRMIGTAEGRRTAARWARSAGGDRPRAMRDFLRSATRLAHHRQHLLLGRGGRTGAVDEQVLLDELVARRAVLTR